MSCRSVPVVRNIKINRNIIFIYYAIRIIIDPFLLAPPTTDPLTSDSRDVHKHGGGVNDL